MSIDDVDVELGSPREGEALTQAQLELLYRDGFVVFVLLPLPTARSLCCTLAPRRCAPAPAPAPAATLCSDASGAASAAMLRGCR